MIIGIDNGVSGAIVVLKDNGFVHTYSPLPTKTGRKAREIDVRALRMWLVHDILCHDVESSFAFFEEPGGSKSSAAAVSMSGSFHAVRAMLELEGVSYDRITPQAWQKAMIPGCKAGQTKPRALAKAKELWPDESFILSRCRVPHNGIIDAALIAEYGRRIRNHNRHELSTRP